MAPKKYMCPKDADFFTKKTENPKKLDFGEKNPIFTKTPRERGATRKRQAVSQLHPQKRSVQIQKTRKKVLNYFMISSGKIFVCIPPHTSRRAGDLHLILEKKFILVS